MRLGEVYTPKEGEVLLQNDPTPTAIRTTVMPAQGNIFAYRQGGERVEVPSNYFGNRGDATKGLPYDPNSAKIDYNPFPDPRLEDALVAVTPRPEQEREIMANRDLTQQQKVLEQKSEQAQQQALAPQETIKFEGQ